MTNGRRGQLARADMAGAVRWWERGRAEHSGVAAFAAMLPERLDAVPSRVAIFVAVGFAALMLLNYAPPWWPMGRDEGVFAYIGRQVLAGGFPYRDVWDHKPPAVYLVHAAALAAGPAPSWAIWAVSLAVAVAIAALSTSLLCGAFGSAPGLLASALLVIVMVDPKVYQQNGFTELFGLGLQWLILWCISRTPRPGYLHVAVAGLASGAAVAFKMTIVAIPLAVFIELMLSREGAARALRATLFAAAALAVCGGLALWLGAGGALSAAWDQLVVYNRVYAAPSPVLQIAIAILQILARNPVNVLGLCAAASLLYGAAPSPTARILARVTLIALPFEVLFLAIPGRFYGHYYLTLLPVLSVRAAVFAAAAFRRWAGDPRLGKAIAAVVVLCLLRLLADFGLAHVRQHRDQVWQTAAVRDVVRDTTGNQSALVWGAEMEINVLSNRRTPSLYGYAYPLFTPGYTRREMWERFADDLRRDPPAVVLDASERTGPPTSIPPFEEIGNHSDVPPETRRELSELLRHYRRQTQADGVVVWLREPHAAASSEHF